MSRLNRISTGVAALATAFVVSACSESDTVLPTDPIGDEAGASFQMVQSILSQNCGTCHGEGSSRAFRVTMDSATFVASGFINPTNPDASLIFVKPRSASGHGGGVISSYTDENIASIKEWVVLQPQLNLSVLEAVPVGNRVKPNFDGYASEAVWRTAPTMVAHIGGGWADAEEVVMSAAYDDEYLYVLARWVDDAASGARSPWIKQADGSWTVLPAKPTPPAGTDWPDFMGANFEEEGPTLFYEDKLAVIWNTYGSTTIAGFDDQGCGVVCHDPSNSYGPGTTYNYSNPQLAAKKYTNSPNELGDIWHWKYVRQNQHYKIDDQYVHYWSQGGEDPNHAGRSADPGSGGYASNPSLNGRPMYRGLTVAGPPYYILDSDKIEVTQEELDALPVGTMMPNMITKGPTDVRADVDAHGVYNPANQTWTLEIRRKLLTGDSHDVQFNDLSREYAFGVAVFDNAQIEHSWSSQAYKMIFKRD